MVRPPQPTHRGGAGTLCVHVVSLCADTKTMTCRPCWDTHILTYQQTDRQTHRHTYINQYKHIVIPIHGCICVTYPPFGGGGGGEPGGAGSYIDYFSDMALLQGSSKRSMGAMVFGFQALIRAISSVAGGPILPVFHQKVGTSIYRLGFRGKMPSIPIRPEMCQNNLTMQTVYAYIQKLDNPKSLSLPLEKLQVEPCLTFQSIDEPSVDERYKNYQRWVKRRGRER